MKVCVNVDTFGVALWQLILYFLTWCIVECAKVYGINQVDVSGVVSYLLCFRYTLFFGTKKGAVMEAGLSQFSGALWNHVGVVPQLLLLNQMFISGVLSSLELLTLASLVWYLSFYFLIKCLFQVPFRL